MPMRDFIITDTRFGKALIRVHDQGGMISLVGDEIPECTIVRTAEDDVSEHIPIGTRDPGALEMTVAGVRATVRPAPGKLTRASYRVDVTCDGAEYRLAPSSPTSSRLSVAGQVVGELEVDDEGAPHATWRQTARPRDAAVGYLLVASFGAGARRLPGLVAEALLGYSG